MQSESHRSVINLDDDDNDSPSKALMKTSLKEESSYLPNVAVNPKPDKDKKKIVKKVRFFNEGKSDGQSQKMAEDHHN